MWFTLAFPADSVTVFVSGSFVVLFAFCLFGGRGLRAQACAEMSFQQSNDVWPSKPQKSHYCFDFELLALNRANSDACVLFCSPLFLELVSSAKNASLIVFLFISLRSMSDCERDLYSLGRVELKP